MIRCKHVSDALSENNWEDLSPFRKFALRLHVMLCAVCGRFNRQIMTMQSTTREFTHQEEHLESGCCIPEDRVEAMKRAIQEAQSSSDQ